MEKWLNLIIRDGKHREVDEMLIANTTIDFRQDDKWITVNGTHVKVKGNGTSKPGEYDTMTGPFKNKKHSDGGKGSGNFGHSGRPGRVGGSGGGEGMSSTGEEHNFFKPTIAESVKEKFTGNEKANMRFKNANALALAVVRDGFSEKELRGALDRSKQKAAKYEEEGDILKAAAHYGCASAYERGIMEKQVMDAHKELNGKYDHMSIWPQATDRMHERQEQGDRKLAQGDIAGAADAYYEVYGLQRAMNDNFQKKNGTKLISELEFLH